MAKFLAFPPRGTLTAIAIVLSLNATGGRAQVADDLATLPPPPDVVVNLDTHEVRVDVPLPDIPATAVFHADDLVKPVPVIAVPAPVLPDIGGAIARDSAALRLATAIEAALEADETTWPRRLAKREREAIAAFYAAREHRPLWLEDGRLNMRASRLRLTLEAAAEHGLNAGDYLVPRLDVVPAAAPETVLAAAELRLSSLAVLYARDARGGRIEPSRLSNLWTPTLRLPAAGEVLDTLAAASDAGVALEAHHPAHDGYRALMRALADLRASHPGVPMVRVPGGPTLKVGMRDPRVPLVRARFGLGPSDAETVYDERVASAVAAFQRDNGLPVSGALTPRTASALSGGGSIAQREALIVANMERWRWLPETLGERHIFVNIPEFRLELRERGAVVHQARVIVGKTETQTPIFSDEMEYAVVNPSWYVPPSILKKEFLPALAANPNYAAERGYEVIRRGNTISVRQPPGERNALGFIKFMFPNQHAVYLHDTPNRRLFGAEKRAFSHGCVRVDQPFRLADFVFEGQWDERRLKALIGKGERHIKLSRPLPVHLAYFTASVAEGRLVVRDDLYGVDRKIIAALMP